MKINSGRRGGVKNILDITQLISRYIVISVVLKLHKRSGEVGAGSMTGGRSENV